MKLYPLKFRPITQYRIWGGNKLNATVPAELQMNNLGEIWSVSGIEGNLSIVENGDLKGRNLKELIEIYQEKLVGEKVWKKFGTEFPLLIKFIDAAEQLSVQVHPNDEQARKLHNSFGKSEMWYILEAEQNAKLIVGFEEGITQKDYLSCLEKENLESILHKVKVKKGDAVYIPAGRVHAIGAGIVLAEIQQTSDITYRIFDYNRTDKNGEKRELHTDLALEAIDFTPIKEILSEVHLVENQFNSLINSAYFDTKIYKGNEPIQLTGNQEMRIYICLEGEVEFCSQKTLQTVSKFESVLIPADCDTYEINSNAEFQLIEVKIP